MIQEEHQHVIFDFETKSTPSKPDAIDSEKCLFESQPFRAVLEKYDQLLSEECDQVSHACLVVTGNLGNH